MGRAVFSGTSWQCFTMICNLQQELARFVGMDKGLTYLKSNYIHFEGSQLLQIIEKNVSVAPLRAMSVLTID